MLSNLNYLLVTAAAACFANVCTAIRVEWNTNTGPIIPPTPRTTIRPVPPFREPAPVWEDLSNDIPNPNPYIYVPPPPSRPKQRLNTNINYNSNDGGNKDYGTLITPQNANNFYQQNQSPQVASLSAQYVPNVGTRYVAVVPTAIAAKSSTSANKYSQTTSSNSLSPDDKTFYKLQGKYNAKTKKYKAYEKVKYVPLNYDLQHKSSDNTTAVPLSPLGDKQLYQLNLPAEDIKKQWKSLFDPITTTVTPMKTTMPFRSYIKHVYAKDKATTTIKPNEKLIDSVDKSKKS